MFTSQSKVLIPLLMAATAIVFAADFPAGPPNLKEAEAKGLQRVNLEELKEFIPGVIKNKGHR